MKRSVMEKTEKMEIRRLISIIRALRLATTCQERRSATMLEIMSFRLAGGELFATMATTNSYENYSVPLCLSPLDSVGLCFFCFKSFAL